MQRLRLDILREPHPASVAAGDPVDGGRLSTDISLAGAAGWTGFRRIVVDKGAPITPAPDVYPGQGSRAFAQETPEASQKVAGG